METWGQIVSMQLTVVGLHLNLGDAAIVVTYVRHVVTLKSTHYAINKMNVVNVIVVKYYDNVNIFAD